MPRYMVCAKLSPAGVAGFRSDGYAKREEAVRTAWEAAGATVEAYYVASPADPWNVVAIVSAPNSDAVFNLAGAVMGSGAATDGMCIELRTPQEADSIIAHAVSYAVPGS